MPHEKPHLAIHEWFAVMAIIAFLAMLILVSLWRQSYSHANEGQHHYLKANEVEIYIQGAVANPGSYKAPTGTLLQDIVKNAQPLGDADLRRIKPSTKARNGQIVNIPVKPKIRVTIEGAVVSAGEIEIPVGTTTDELISYILPTEDADLSKIKKGRRLRQNDKIVIPKKIR